MLIVASPLAYVLGTAEIGNAVSASIAAATAAAALAVPMWSTREDGDAPVRTKAPGAAAMDTGRAQAEGGGNANSGIRRPRGAGGPVHAERTGPAIARGRGSHANSGAEEADEW